MAQKKAQKAKAKNGNGRIKNADRVLQAWGKGTWPPEIGEKIKVWLPKELRGSTGKVIATPEERGKGSTRHAPEGKVRVISEGYQFAVTQAMVFPANLKLKDITAKSE